MPRHILVMASRRLLDPLRELVTIRRAAVVCMVVAVMLWITSAAAATTPTPAPTSWESDKRTELFFGGTRRDDGAITPAEFEMFLDKDVTPAFPEGLTWLPVHGRRMGSKQDSYLLILLYPDNNRRADQDIEEIRSDYKSQFGQESVLRADSTERVSF